MKSAGRTSMGLRGVGGNGRLEVGGWGRIRMCEMDNVRWMEGGREGYGRVWLIHKIPRG